MKVLYLVSWYKRPGSPTSGYFFYQLAKGISQYADEVVVACVHLKFIGIIDHIGLTIHKENNLTEYMLYVPMLIPRWQWLYNICGRLAMKHLLGKIEEKYGKFDIIHVQSAFSAALYAEEYLENNETPVVYTEHSSAVLNDRLNRCGLEALKVMARRADVRVAVSNVLAEKLMKYVTDVKVIGNMVDIGGVSQRSERFTFVCLSTLRADKGLKELVTAFAEEFDAHMPVTLLLGGEGEYRRDLETLIRQIAPSHDIQLHGHIPHEDVSSFLQKGHCFVLPSRYETFGIVYIEAMACGLPVIATKCGGPEEYVNETNGILVDVGNQEQLRKAMRWMYKNIQLYDANRIATDIEVKFSERSICEQYYACYQNLLREKQK